MIYFWRKSSTEELQHALQTIPADIPETSNIVDNIPIFAENTKQHDETLTRVLERCESKGTTPDLEKNIFSEKNLMYYGFMFSEKAMKTDPEMIQETREIP